MTDQELITSLIRRNATIRTLAKTVVDAHDQNNHEKMDNSVFALKEYLKAPVSKPRSNERFIRLYAWDDTPLEYQALSDHGGDEDWVVIVPADMAKGGVFRNLPTPLEEAIRGDSNYIQGFGHIGRYKLDTGEVVLIFAHT